MSGVQFQGDALCAPGRLYNVLMRFIFAAVLAITFVVPSSARELHWKSLDVDARLDNDGQLHVVERQHYVFNGDWNGGERKFNVRFGQNLELVRLSRISNDGTRIDLRNGGLAAIDEFAWAEGKTLRWRSRNESDPPFENTELIYEIEYLLSNILLTKEKGGQTTYVLDHDFAFAERDGVIERYSLDLELGDSWTPVTPVRSSYTGGPLHPGSGFPLDIELAWKGAGAPAGVKRGAPMVLKYAVLFGAISVVFLMLTSFFSLERSRHRFDDEQIREIDEAWLEKNVFFAPPEVIGALWDTSTGAAEVAAMMARLAQEKKIETKVLQGGLFSKPTLEMKLLVPRERFSEMERPLIDAFFVDGDTTSTEKIRSHYKSRGFNPSSTISEGLDAAIGGNRSWADQKVARNWWRDILLVIAAIAMLAVAAIRGQEDTLGAGLVGGIGIFTLVFGSIAAAASRNAIGTLGRWAFAFSLLTIIQLIVFAGFAFSSLTISSFTYVAMSVAIAIFYWFVIGWAPFRESLDRLAVRKRLRTGRAFFERELKKPQPALRDEWFPYVMAFGLGKNVDSWFSSFGGASSRATSGFSGSGSSSSGSGSSGGSWSGGGGSFGGAGASGAWAVAAGGLASGVAAPSSSSGGGGGGGSSSGGGGGGGW